MAEYLFVEAHYDVFSRFKICLLEIVLYLCVPEVGDVSLKVHSWVKIEKELVVTVSLTTGNHSKGRYMMSRIISGFMIKQTKTS